MTPIEPKPPCPQSPAAPGSAITVAHEWLRNSREEWLGPMREWTQENRDNYHRDLGLLVDFVTDCWPNVPVSDTAP